MQVHALLKENIVLLDTLLSRIEQETGTAALQSYFQVITYYNAFFTANEVVSYQATHSWTKDEAVTRGKSLLSSLLRITGDDWLHVQYEGSQCPSSISRELAFLALQASITLKMADATRSPNKMLL